VEELAIAWRAVQPWAVALVPSPEELPRVLWDLTRYLLYFSVFYVAIKVVNRLPLIREIITGFNDARGPIWDMRNTVEDFKSTIAELSKIEPVIKTVRDQIALLDEKIDAAQKQVEELQRHSASERTEARSSPEFPAPSSLGVVAPSDDEANWQRLREIWRAHVARLEALIEGMDGRKARSYRKMTRYDYKPIIDKLLEDGLLSPASAKSSKDLMETFSSYRPRNRKVPDKVVGDMIVLDRQLAAEVIPEIKKPKPEPVDELLVEAADPTPAVDSSSKPLA
jgi:hypothetical protein